MISAYKLSEDLNLIRCMVEYQRDWKFVKVQALYTGSDGTERYLESKISIELINDAKVDTTEHIKSMMK